MRKNLQKFSRVANCLLTIEPSIEYVFVAKLSVFVSVSGTSDREAFGRNIASSMRNFVLIIVGTGRKLNDKESTNIDFLTELRNINIC